MDLVHQYIEKNMIAPAEARMPTPLARCEADRDGECVHKDCPQLRDCEPAKSGRHCPLDQEGGAA